MPYPDDLPTFSNPLASDPRVGHATLHGAVNDALEEVAAYVANATRLVDLGVVDATDLLAGPVTLYTPSAGELVMAGYGSDVTPFDSGAGTIEVTSSAGAGVISTLVWVDDQSYASGPGDERKMLAGNPIIATLWAPGFSHPVVGSWTANTAYAQDDAIIVAGIIWYALVGGTSGATEPVWGDAVDFELADNDITWGDTTDAAPATGSAHFYALVAKP